MSYIWNTNNLSWHCTDLQFSYSITFIHSNFKESHFNTVKFKYSSVENGILSLLCNKEKRKIFIELIHLQHKPWFWITVHHSCSIFPTYWFIVCVKALLDDYCHWCKSDSCCLVVVLLVAQSCPALCDPMHCSPPASSIHRILQTRILGWLPFPSSCSLVGNLFFYLEAFRIFSLPWYW